ncbi:MAG: methylmalonyl-CoA mutase subunit beta [Bacteroidia bacterium]
MEKLLQDFKPVSAREWEEKILKDLKCSSIEELIWHTPEGIPIRPFYAQEHLRQISTPPVFFQTNFDIVQYIPASNHSSEEINEFGIKSLNGGAAGLAIEFYQKHNFSECFNNISLPHIYSNIHASFDAIDIINELKEIYWQNNEYTGQKNCFINIDPLFLFEKFGEWHENQQKDFEVLRELNHIPVNAVLYKESGANAVQELAYTLAHLNEYLLFLEQQQQLSKYKYIHITVSVGSSFFTEISKLRALRILVQHLLQEYHYTAHVHIHAQTALINKSYLDIYNNLIRTTTEAMSAVFGGANSISILPFDFPFNKISDFSLRMARNQLIIMKEESYLNKTAEAAAGSFYVENYTHQLVQSAYEKFLSIEKQNGLIPLLENNTIQSEIRQSFDAQLQKYIENKEILIGINKYPNPQQEKKYEFHYPLNVSTTTNILSLKYQRFAEYFEHQTQTV